MNRTMPNQEQRPRSGTKMQQKPMPKQDKGGGIIPAAEGARLRISRLRGGAAKCRPAVLFFRPLLAF